MTWSYRISKPREGMIAAAADIIPVFLINSLLVFMMSPI